MTAFGLGLFAFLLLAGGAFWLVKKNARARGWADAVAAGAKKLQERIAITRRIENKIKGLSKKEAADELEKYATDAVDRRKPDDPGS